MARASDQFRQSDVTFWGIVALFCGGLALITANVSAVVPDNVFAMLHATRLSAASVNEMHTELSSLEDEEARLSAANTQLAARFEMADRNADAVRQRVGALEVSVPLLTEAMNAHEPIDDSLTTGAIGESAAAGGDLFPADGGSVKVRRLPLNLTSRGAPGPTFTSSGAAAGGRGGALGAIAMAASAADAAATSADGSAAAVTSSIPPAAGLIPVTAADPSGTDAGAATDTPLSPQPMPAPLPPPAAEPASGAQPASVPSAGAPVAAGAAGPAAAAMPATAVRIVDGQPLFKTPPGISVAPGAATADAGPQAVPSPADAAPTGPVPLPRPLLRADALADGTPATSAGLAADATAPTQLASAEAAPPSATGDVAAIGVAIGTPVQPAGALAAWQGVAARVGIMLVGTSPLLADDPAGSTGKVLVAGPLPSIAKATALCANITRAGLTCMPMPYVGMPVTAAPRRGTQ